MQIQNKSGVEQSSNPQVVKVGSNLSAIADNEGTVTMQVDESTVVANTNGTTAVSVFGASGLPYAITITGVYLVSQDTTAGNITVEAPAATTVCTIAKGTTAAAMVGATTLSNTSVAAETNVVVDSSSAGNARVFITYEPA